MKEGSKCDLINLMNFCLEFLLEALSNSQHCFTQCPNTSRLAGQTKRWTSFLFFQPTSWCFDIGWNLFPYFNIIYLENKSCPCHDRKWKQLLCSKSNEMDFFWDYVQFGSIKIMLSPKFSLILFIQTPHLPLLG